MGQLFGKKKDKKCCCTSILCRCNGRCVPLVVDTTNSVEIPNPDCINPIPVELGVDIGVTSSHGGTCFNGSGRITYKTALTGGVNCWEGTLTGSCTDCNGVSRTWSLFVKMCCPDSTHGATVSLAAGTPAVIPIEESAVVVVPTSCDLFLVDGCIPGDINGFVVACLGTMSPTQQVFTDVCFQIYELP